jgi:hypothetical protein
MSVLIWNVPILFLFRSVLCDMSFKLSKFPREYAVLMKCYRFCFSFF